MTGGCNAAALVSGSPKRRVKSRPTSSPSIGPKPAIAPGALKSHEFSDRPTKSRIAGSNDHTRRSAARVKSSGTPVSRKARILDSAPTDSIVGKLAGSNGSIFSLRLKRSRIGFRRRAGRGLDLLRLLDLVRSRVVLATGPSRKKIRVVTHRRSYIAGHAVPALLDPHDCACASRRSARHGIRR